jgi:hypothetical protein
MDVEGAWPVTETKSKRGRVVSCEETEVSFVLSERLA